MSVYFYLTRCRLVGYNTHFLSVLDLRKEDEEGDPLERLLSHRQSASAEQIVYRKVCLELLELLFRSLSAKDRSILGHAFGVYGYEKTVRRRTGPAGDALPRWRDEGPKDGPETSAAEISRQRPPPLAGDVPVGKQGQTRNRERKLLPALSGMVGIQNHQR